MLEIPEKSANDNDIFWSRKGMYTTGSLFIHFLVEGWDWGKLKELFLISEFEDPDFQEHFFEVYETKPSTLEDQWRMFVSSNSGVH